MTSIPDSHLQSPIRIETRQYLHEDHTKIANYLKEIILDTPVNRYKVHLNSERVYGKLLSHIFTRDHISDWVLTHVPKVIKIVQDHVVKHAGELFTRALPNKTNFTSTELQLWSSKVDWEDIRTSMQYLKARDIKKWIPIRTKQLGFDHAFVSSHFLIVHIDKKWWALDYEQVMMISDTVSSRVFNILYHSILDHYVPGKVDQNTLITIYQKWDKIFIEDKNDSYDSIKFWESIIQAIILKENDPFEMASDYMTWLTKELETNGKRHSLDMLNYLLSLKLSIYQLSELHGIYRQWGHPTVNESAGCAKVKNIAKARPLPKWSTIHDMVALMKRQFIISFIGIHGRWPKATLDEKYRKTPLYNMIKRNTTHISLYSSVFKMDHWYKVQLGKEFDFDYYLDFTELIDDKALSPLREELRSIYNPIKLGYRPSDRTKSRRVLPNSLERFDINIEDICSIISSGNIPHNWKIVLLHAKERELKISPRLFAMLVLEMRLYFCVTEKNLANVIFKYYPQQTMTMDEIDLTRRLYAMSSTREFDHFLPIISSIDFQSWNIHWQLTSTGPFFEIIDDLFGTPGLYFYTHVFFEESLISLASHHNPPSSLINNISGEPIECETLWLNHKGGFEGLRQKGWTLITICLLLLVEYRTGIKSYIVGQGDNQVCKLMIIKDDPKLPDEQFIINNQNLIRERVSLFLNVIEISAREIGLVIKKEESWVSSCLISYGKDMLYKGAFLPQGGKRMSRMMVDVNEIYPTLFLKISTLQTTGLSTAQKSYTVIEPYIMCLIETLLTIIKEIDFPLILQGKKYPLEIKQMFRSESFLIFLLHLNSDIGACPILPLLSYLYRGHPDSLTTYTTQLDYGKAKDCRYCIKMISFLGRNHYRLGEASSELLISNPTATNVYAPSQLGTILRKYLEQTIRKHARNKNISNIFHTANPEKTKEICDYMINTYPLYPRVLHEMLSNTIIGAKMSFMSKFSNTRTTQLMFSKEGVNLQHSILLAENKLVGYWIELFGSVLQEQDPQLIIDPTRLAQQIRDFSWGSVIKHKIEGVTIPHPAHQFKVNKNKGITHDDCIGSSEYILFKINFASNTDIITKKGPYPPYLGSRTKEKMTGKIYQVAESGRPLRAAQRLMQLSSWCVEPDSYFSKFIESLAMSRTNLDPRLILMSTGHVTSGSMTHRLDDHATKNSTQNNCRPNSTTHIYPSTDDMGKFSRGQENYNMHFQGALHLGYAIIHLDAVKNEMDYLTLHLHVGCHECLDRIDDMKIQSSSVPPVVDTYQSNPLIYTNIHYAPKILNTPELFIKIVNPREGAMAAGSLLLSRIMRNINFTQWGVTETSANYVSPIGIKELIRLTLDKILDYLSMYLYLYLYEIKDNLELFIERELTHEVWRDLSSNCLLPEILPELSRLACGRQQPGIFHTPFGASRLLSKALSMKIKSVVEKIKNHKNVNNLTFYILPTCGLKRIFNMWGNYIECVYGFNPGRDLYDCLETETIGMQMPSHQSFINLYNKIHQIYTPDQIEIIMRCNPLWISSTSPESVIHTSLSRIRAINPPISQDSDNGEDRKISRDPQPSGIRPVKLVGKFVTQIYVPEVTSTRVPFTLLPQSLTIILPKTYQDHQFGLTGRTSCAYLKYLEILIRYRISTKKPCIALADGEGGVSYLLHKFTNTYVYYNSLIKIDTLISNRAVKYVPCSFIGNPSMVRSAEISALSGGDITDSKFRDSFISSITDDTIGILTFDAESNHAFDLSTIKSLCDGVFQIIHNIFIENVIYKTYIDNLEGVLYILNKFQSYYDNISVCVPCFSSNETYEIFIIGQQRKTMCLYTNFDSIDSSLHSMIVPLMKIRKDRLKEYPHQTVDCDWRALLRLSIDMGIGLNIETYLETWVSDFQLYNQDIDIISWLKNVKEKADSILKEEILMLYKSSKGLKLTLTQKILMEHTNVIHISIERYIVIGVNAEIMITMSTINNCDEVNKFIQDFMSQGLDYNIDGDTFYKFDPTLSNWRNRFLKPFWKVWGYIKHKNDIMDK